jgi:hypothetical protein
MGIFSESKAFKQSLLHVTELFRHSPPPLAIAFFGQICALSFEKRLRLTPLELAAIERRAELAIRSYLLDRELAIESERDTEAEITDVDVSLDDINIQPIDEVETIRNFYYDESTDAEDW